MGDGVARVCRMQAGRLLDGREMLIGGGEEWWMAQRQYRMEVDKD